MREDAERYQVIKREISQEEFQRILDGLTSRHEKMLFGLEPPDEPRRAGAPRRAGSGGDLKCPYCEKDGLTTRGLSLHISRMHKEKKPASQSAA